MPVTIIPVTPKKGALHGYRVILTTNERRKILKKVAEMEASKKKNMNKTEKMRAGLVAVIRRLNLIATYNKRNLEANRIMKNDIAYLQKLKNQYQVEKGYTIKSRTRSRSKSRSKSRNTKNKKTTKGKKKTTKNNKY